MREIKMRSGGRVALVDDADYARLSSFVWFPWGRSGDKNQEPRPARNLRHSDGRWENRLMHHDILPYPFFGLTVDHADGNPWNNQRKNLRYATGSQQATNSKKRRMNGKSSSRFKGVSFDSAYEKWRAEIYFQKKRYFVGFFAEEESAARAWDIKAKELHGEFARLNFPPPLL